MTPELRQLYELKLLDAPAYILLIVKAQRAAGWRWTFKVKDFCKKWGITTPTFYRAVSKLKTMGLLHWETGETITVWHSADIASSLTNDIILSPENSLTDENQSITRENGILTDENGLSPMRIQTPETLASIAFQNAPDINQIFLDQTDNTAAEKTSSGKKEEDNQEGINLHTPASLIEESKSRVKPAAAHDDQGSTAPLVPELSRRVGALKAVLPSVDLPTQAVVSPAPLVPLSVESAPIDLLDEREALKEMRKLGIKNNQEVRARMKKYPTNVPWSLANIRRRVAKGEHIKNITGAFMVNLKTAEEDREPIDNEPSFGLHYEVNPPTEQQLQALEDARNKRLILDYFFSSIDNTHKVILNDGLTQVFWWEYLASLQETCP